jgi:hypothetical protein
MPFDFNSVAEEASPKSPSKSEFDFTPFESGALGFAHSIVPSAAALAGAGVGAELGSPAGPVGMVVGAIGGGVAAGFGASAAQEAVLPESTKRVLSKAEKDNPKSYFAGELGANLPFLGVGSASKTVRGVMAALGGGQEAVREATSKEGFDFSKIGMAAAAGGSLAKVTKLGGKLAPFFKEPEVKPTITQEKLPKTPENVDAIINKWTEDNKGKWSDLKETAFRNKETGEIEGSGPKHDEAKKAEQLPSDNKGIEQEANKKISTLNDPPKDYHPKDAIEAKHWAETQLKSVKDEDARASLQILIKQADEIIKGDQHPSVVKEHGIEIKRNDNYIDVVKLPKDLQKQGLGSKIVANLESDIKKEGHKDAFLIATPDSVEFWRKQGYRITSKGDEGIQMSKTFKEEATGPLAKTDKENHISLNHTAIENDFSSGFKYIFDASTETGKQKQIVFNKLGITKEGFSKLITSVGDYKNFLRAHEESHVAHNDRESYPKTKEGKIDLFNPKAIEIETRATKDALNSVAKHKEQTGTHTPETDASKYNQGFLDNKGNFLNRKEALDRAVETKQIPADHFLDELHSTDLRDAGDRHFQTEHPVPAELPHPASVSTADDFHEQGRKILDEHGPEVAKKWAQDVAEYNKKNAIPVAKDDKELADSFHNLDTMESADRSEAMTHLQEWEKQGIDDKMQSKFYDFKEGHGGLDFTEREAWDKTVGKDDKELKGLYDRQVKLSREVSQELDPSFMSRMRLWAPKNIVEGWKQLWERATRQEGAFSDKVEGDPTSLEKRSLFVLEGKSGSRQVIQKVGDKIITWNDGKPSGFWKKDAKGDLEFKGKSIKNQVKDIKEEVFSGKTLREARVDELHQHTPYRYSKNAALVTKIKLNELRKFDRASNFIDAFKESAIFKANATKDINNIPKGWITPKSVARIPQLAGYFFEPKTAYVIEDFAKHFDNSMYMKLTSALIKNMMLNPLPHMFNEAMHVFVARGVTGWVTPKGFDSFLRTGSKAMQDVWNQSDLYREVMREGGSMMSPDLRANQFHDQILDKAAKEAFPEISNIAAKAGLKPAELYQGMVKWSNKAMWMTRDAMYLQLIREHQIRNPGAALKDSIKQIEQHMPNYRVPTTIMGNRGLSVILQNPNVSVFSKYHYGLVNSMMHVVKDMNPKNLKSPEGQVAFRRGLDSALAYAIGILAIYPMMDEIAKAMFGNDTMEQRRAGPFHLIEAIKNVSQGKADTQALLSPIFTFNPVLATGGSLIFNRKLPYSDRHIFDTKDPMDKIAYDAGKYTLHSIPQAGAIMDTSDTGGGFLAKQLDIKSKSEADTKRAKRAVAIIDRKQKQDLKKWKKEHPNL